MSASRFVCLQDVIADEAFPDVDMALRRGRHIGREDSERYEFLSDAAAELEAFYRRYGCDLVHKSEGYYYLLPTSDRLGRRQLSVAEMLVGQTLTLLYLDPGVVQEGGTVDREQVLSQLSAVMGTDALIRALNPKRRRFDPRIAEQTVRVKVAEALRRLASLGFIAIVDQRIRLRPALMRFAEPVRGTSSPQAELERLVAAGEVLLGDPEAPEEPTDVDALSEPDEFDAGLDASAISSDPALEDE